MKRFAGFALAMLFCMGIMTGCGGQSYEADVSTVFVEKDGKIVSTDVEAFDENTYDKEGLEAYVNKAVSAYNSDNGEDSVVMKELKIEEGNAVLILEYASASDYAGFNGIELYTGSVADALSAGYSFDVEFASVADGEASVCNVNDFLGNGDYRAVIIRGNADVHVDGKVAYISTVNTTYVDASTVRIQEGTSLLGQALSEAENTESAAETKEGTEKAEDTQAQPVEDDGVVSEDELLLETEEPEKVEFVFDEEEQKPAEEPAEFSQVYTYIIYR